MLLKRNTVPFGAVGIALYIFFLLRDEIDKEASSHIAYMVLMFLISVTTFLDFLFFRKDITPEERKKQMLSFWF